MNNHHTKYKGDIGLSKILSDLISKHYFVSIPISENAPFDLIATKNNKNYTIQCKYRKVNKNGNITIYFRSVWADKNGIHAKKYKENSFDILAIYIEDIDKCIYLKYMEINHKKSISIRINNIKSNQKIGIFHYEDYLFI